MAFDVHFENIVMPSKVQFPVSPPPLVCTSVNIKQILKHKPLWPVHCIVPAQNN